MPAATTLMATLTGAAVGGTLALTGAGGGILAVPLLVFMLAMDVAAAAPIGLLAVGSAAALGTVIGLRAGRVRYRAVLMMGLGAVVSVPAGQQLAQVVPRQALTAAFACVLIGVARKMWGSSKRGGAAPASDRASAVPCVLNPVTGRLIWTPRCARALFLTGLTAGFMTGALGVGGGFVIVPALTRISNLGAATIANTSLGTIAIASALGVTSAVTHGGMDWPIALPFALGSLVALAVGLRFAKRCAGITLQRSFALLCVCTATGLLLRDLHPFLQP